MAIIIDENTRVMIQGITGSVGRMFAQKMIHNKTPLVAGVTPGKGGQEVYGIPVYNTVEEAVKERSPNTSLVVVPPQHVKDATIEAIDAGIKVIIIYTEGVPIHDALYIVNYSKVKGSLIIGPNAAGIASPGKGNVSDISDDILSVGNIGIVSRSGTLSYEVIYKLKSAGLGISTVACIGGDPVIGLRYRDILEMFERDPETKAVILLGEIGGTDEIKAAEYIKSMSKPVYAYIAGWSAPPGKRMGHAGAIVIRGMDSALYKQQKLREAGAYVFSSINELVKSVISDLGISSK